MIKTNVQSVLAIAAAFSEVHVAADRAAGVAKNAIHEAAKAKLESAGLAFEMQIMQQAAADLLTEYHSTQLYAGALEEQNRFLREQLAQLPNLDVNKVARLMTAMVVGNKTAIGEAVQALLPQLDLHQAIDLASNAVTNASGIMYDGDDEVVEPIEPDDETSGVKVLEEDDEPTVIIPKISAKQSEANYPIDGASIG